MWGTFTAWLDQLEPPFAFLLILPFVVALVGLLTELAERRGREVSGAKEHDHRRR